MVAGTIAEDPQLEIVNALMPRGEAIDNRNVDEEQIWYPTSTEEFEQMVTLMDERGHG